MDLSKGLGASGRRTINLIKVAPLHTDAKHRIETTCMDLNLTEEEQKQADEEVKDEMKDGDDRYFSKFHDFWVKQVRKDSS